MTTAAPVSPRIFKDWCGSPDHAYAGTADPVECVTINGASICKACLGSLVPSGWMKDAKADADYDEWLREVWDDVEDEVRSAADAAINSALDAHRPARKVA